jgi:hypothetical protein
MKAITLTEFGAPPALRDDLPAPTPGAGEVLVRVYASSVNPIDNGIAARDAQGHGPARIPIALGRDRDRPPDGRMTRSSCAASGSATSSIATATWSPPCASVTLTVSMRSSTTSQWGLPAPTTAR